MRPGLLSVSIDDGHPLDLKTAEILAKKNIEATFYIPIKNSTGKPTLNKRQINLLSKQFRIGSHTYNHVDLTKVSLKKAKEEIRAGKEALEEIIGKKITTFAWPWGRYNSKLIDLVKSSGFLDCRSAAVLNFNTVKKNFLWHPNLHIYPHPTIRDLRNCMKRIDLYSLIIRIKNIKKSHLELISILQSSNRPYHLWFHSWEIEQAGLWEIIKAL